jgi:hypothetical protein
VSFILEDFILKIHMGEHHASAAVPLQTQIIQNLLGRFSLGNPAGKLFPQMTNGFSTGKTADRNNH